jgi:hypothetical protein
VNPRKPSAKKIRSQAVPFRYLDTTTLATRSEAGVQGGVTLYVNGRRAPGERWLRVTANDVVSVRIRRRARPTLWSVVSMASMASP